MRGQNLPHALGGELDVVLVRKLRAPFNPEFAVGSIDESGWIYVAEHAGAAGATTQALEREARAYEGEGGRYIRPILLVQVERIVAGS